MREFIHQTIYLTAVILVAGTAIISFANNNARSGELMSAKGTFEVNLTSQEDEPTPAGRMVIDKTYTGDLVGTGMGQMISKRTEGSSVYYAIEEFVGSLGDKRGSFTLIHKGLMNKESQSLEVLILEGSGDGELMGITGSLDIIQKDGGHSYVLNYRL